MIYLLYTCGLCIAFILFSPYFLVQMIRTHKYREGLSHRFGRIPQQLHTFCQTSSPFLWIHAVSVGEVNSIQHLIPKLKETFPAARIVLSTTTKTGHHTACQRYDQDAKICVIYFPLDFPWIVRAYIHKVRPRAILILETEIWPNFLHTAHKASIPVFLISGRISDKAFGRYRIMTPFLKKPLSHFQGFCMQSQDTADRIIKLGASPDKVHITGSLKFDYRPPKNHGDASCEWLNKLHLTASTSVLIAGSTHKGEERLMLDAYASLIKTHRDSCLILAPRHPERFRSVETLIQQSAFANQYQKLSQHISQPSQIYLVDTLGILGTLYSIGGIIIMGGSFVPVGGHNILEPAAYAKPVICGPHMQNFQDMLHTFLQHHAVIQIQTAEDLLPTLESLIKNPHQAKNIGLAALNTLRTSQGATQKTLDIIRAELQNKPNIHNVL